jgi:hypothetical protein
LFRNVISLTLSYGCGSGHRGQDLDSEQLLILIGRFIYLFRSYI